MPWTRWTAFATLCILSGTSWVIPAEMSDGLSALEQQGLIFSLVGLAALMFVVREKQSRSNGRWVGLAGAGVGFFGVPMVVAEYARGSVPATSRSALFAMVPVVVVMMIAAGHSAEREEGARRFLAPALAGLGGLLLLLPLQFSGSARGSIMLAVVCATVVLVGVASVWLYRSLHGIAFAKAVAVVGFANAVFLLVWSAVRGDMTWRWSGVASVLSVSTLVDVVEVLLLLWLMREMQPMRFAARYLAIPLVTVLESYVLVRPELTVRMGFGTVLLAVGTGMLLFLNAGEEETVLSLH